MLIEKNIAAKKEFMCYRSYKQIKRRKKNILFTSFYLESKNYSMLKVIPGLKIRSPRRLSDLRGASYFCATRTHITFTSFIIAQKFYFTRFSSSESYMPSATSATIGSEPLIK